MDQYRYIYIDGKLCNIKERGVEISRLLDSNYTYRTLHTVAHHPLHIDTQLKLLVLSYGALFGHEPVLEQEKILKDIADLLYRNNAPSGSNLVKIIVAPLDEGNRPSVMISYHGPMMYPEYCIWHKPAAALPLTYEIPFPMFKTAANYLSHNYARQYAVRMGQDEVISVNYGGEAVSLGENPLFAISGRNVYTSDAAACVPQSAERLFGIELCEKAGLTLIEKGIPAESLDDMDELFAFTLQGILPVGRVKKRLYAPTVVKTLEPYLRELTGCEFL